MTPNGILGFVLGAYIIFLAILTVKGYFQNKNSENAADNFLTGGKNSNIWSIAFTIFCNAIGVAAIVGVCTDTYTKGFFVVYYVCLRVLAYVLVGLIPGPRVQQAKSFSAATLLGGIFGRSAQYIFGIQNGLICGLLTSASIIAIGGLGEMMFGISRSVGLVVATLIFAAVAVAGGLVSTNLTNYLNTFLMVGGTVLLGILATIKGGGLTSAIQNAVAVGGEKFAIGNLSGGGTTAIILAYFFSTVVAAAAGGPEMLVAYSAKTPKAAKRGIVIGAFMILIIAIPVHLLAYVGVAIRPDANPSSFFYTYSMEIQPVVGALAIAGVLAAAVSTASCLALGAVSNFTSVYNAIRETRGKKPLSGKQSLIFSRAVVIISFAAGLAMSFKTGSIVSMVVSVCSFATCAGICWFAVLLFPQAFRKSSFVATVAASIVGGVLYMFIPALAQIIPHTVYIQMLFGAIAYVVTLIVDKRRISLKPMYSDEVMANWTAEERWTYLREKDPK